jgi:hypothetical protein
MKASPFTTYQPYTDPLNAVVTTSNSPYASPANLPKYPSSRKWKTNQPSILGQHKKQSGKRSLKQSTAYPFGLATPALDQIMAHSPAKSVATISTTAQAAYYLARTSNTTAYAAIA